MLKKCKLLVLFLFLTGFIIAGCSGHDSKPDGTQLTGETSAASEAAETKVANDNISAKTKNYISAGQDDKPDADKIKWSEAFLNQVDIDAVYQEYLSDGGTADDVTAFALYLTLHAPVADNWQDLTAVDLLNLYDEKISNIEYLQYDLYQVYVEIEGSDVPYVVVNARTGYFHG